MSIDPNRLISRRTLSESELRNLANLVGGLLRSGGAGGSIVGADGFWQRDRPRGASGETRPAKITAVTTAYGPPSTHTYNVEFLDYTGGTANDLDPMQKRPASVRTVPLAVNDVVLVVYKLESGDWVIEGFLRPEPPQFVLCECT